MTINYRKMFLAIIVALMISVPTAIVFKNHNKQIEFERKQNKNLELNIQKKDSDYKKLKIQSDEQKKKDDAEKQKLQEENEKLQKDLQAKAERKAEEKRLAAAAEKAAASVSVASAPAQSGGGCDAYRGMLAQYDWNVDTMARIMNAESGCNPTNHNYGDNHGSCLGSYGLMQVGCVHGYSAAYLSSPANNIAAAYKIFKSQGYTAWSTY